MFQVSPVSVPDSAYAVPSSMFPPKKVMEVSEMPVGTLLRVHPMDPVHIMLLGASVTVHVPASVGYSDASHGGGSLSSSCSVVSNVPLLGVLTA